MISLRSGLFIGATLVAALIQGPPSSAAAADSASPQVRIASLLKDATNLAALAEFPSPPYVCKQFSSYDRNSKSVNQDWFANNDAGQYLRTEEHAGRKEYVMMDAAGPGAIVRIWSANPAGTLRVYIDEAGQPALEAPMDQLLGGKFPNLPRPIAGEYSKGWNLYFPIPYERHCKVTSDAGNFYYHVNYRTYPMGTAVQSFALAQLSSLAAPIASLQQRLANPRGKEAELDGATDDFDLPLGPGETFRHEFTGPKALTWVVLRVTAQDRSTALRGVVARIRFDNELCVEGPLGDLFGSAPDVNPYSTLPLGMTKDGEMYAHWFMPFRESAVIELVNHSSSTATLAGRLAVNEYVWNDRSMHFHAKWRAQLGVPTRPMQDWNYLTARGQGVFAGVAFAIDNPVKDWWGEGDEKIYVDGEAFPSHFGTGTEDYYGYAWCWPATFTHAYHSQPRCDGPANYGRTSVNRYHILDRIPFTTDFKFDMELWHWNAKCRVNMAVTAYWYARPGATDAFRSVRAEDAVVQPMPQYVVPRVAGAIEGEGLKIKSVTGTAEPQSWDDVSGGSHLWWHAGMKPGDTLTLAFMVKDGGRYQILGRFLKARDYGVHQLSINGQAAGEPRDFYNPDVKPSEEIVLGTFELRPGENELAVEVVGANAKAVKAYMFGLDYLRLVRE